MHPNPHTTAEDRCATTLFTGPGELRERCRALDWGATALGRVETWSPALRSVAQLVLAHPFPTFLFWGDELVQIYNDACRDLLGPRHPGALGLRESESWSELWHAEASIFERVWRGESVVLEDVRLPTLLPNAREDASFTVSASPVHEETGDIAGVMLTIVETSAHLRAQGSSSHRGRADEGEPPRVSDTLRQQLIAAEENERRRISRELHDQLGQQLTALSLGLDEVRRMVRESPTPGRERDALRVMVRLRTLQNLTAALTTDAHNLAVELRPAELDDVGLASALATYVTRWSSRTHAHVDLQVSGIDEESIAPDVGTAIYRIVQEALTNVVRHARAEHVSVILERTAPGIRLIVEDDGCGFDAEETIERSRGRPRLGLNGMRERAMLVGGTFRVDSEPGSGTTIFVTVTDPQVTSEIQE